MKSLIRTQLLFALWLRIHDASLFGDPLPLRSLEPPVMLPDGTEFKTWEQPLRFDRTYYVDQAHPDASDANPGTSERPFKTINRAAQVLQPGERVVVAAGVYRERVRPARGGSAPDRMMPPVVGFHIVRRNIVADCGICGICGLGPARGRDFGLLIEDNVLARNAFHDVERLYETAGIKTHNNIRCLIRRNVILDTFHGAGIWMDWNNQFSRCTGNLIVGSHTMHGGIFIEASYEPNLVDQNVIWNTDGHGIYEHDCCGQIFANNLIAHGSKTGFHLHGKITDRQVDGRRMTYGRHSVRNNVLIGNARTNEFLGDPSTIAHNVEDGATARLDLESHEFAWEVPESGRRCPLEPGFTYDLLGQLRSGQVTCAGPFADPADRIGLSEAWPAADRIRLTAPAPPAVARQASTAREERVRSVTSVPGCVAFWDFVKREPDGAHRFTAHVLPGATNDFALDAGNYIKDYWGEGREAMVAHNSAILEEGYIYAGEYLKRLNPDILIGGHSFVMDRPAQFIARYRRWAYEMRDAFQSLSSEKDYRYGFDPFWVRAEPYRVSVQPGELVQVRLHVRNFQRDRQAHRIEIHMPPGIVAEPAVLEGRLPGRARESFPVVFKALPG